MSVVIKPVSHFQINYLQFLNEKAQLAQRFPEFANTKHLLELYRKMVLVRTFDVKAVNLQRVGKLGTYPAILGQEATSVGAGAALESQDYCCPYYRDIGVYFARGVAMHEVLQFWGGDERGSCYENNPKDLPICALIAGQCLHGAGVAYAVKYRKEKAAVLTTLGDGATSKGDFYEALNLAGAWHLPLVFVINNNSWAISTPLSEQTASKTLAQKAIAAGVTGIQVDGNDPVAVEYATREALNKARSGGGPTLIEALTYRLHDHTTTDDASRYADPKMLEQAKAIEPIARMRKYLIAQKHWDDEKEAVLLDECRVLVEAAVEKYLNMPAPKVTDMFDYQYETLPKTLERERAKIKN